MSTSSATKQRVLIVGGGFAGVKTALELSGNEALAVTLLSEHSDFRYYPTFYHTATGGLKSQSSIPLDQILDDRVKRVVAKAESLDRRAQQIIAADGTAYAYDILVLALGTVTNYFGIKGLAEYSYGIKSIEEIRRFKAHLHDQLSSQHKPDLHYVIVGAGPTGIELAGALPAYLRAIMRNHGIRHRAVHIDLIEAAPRLLPRSNKAVSRAVRRRLRQLGVRIYLNQAVQGENADEIIINGKPLPSRTVIWTAGMATNPFYQANGFTFGDHGKVKVDDYLMAEPDIYVLGDNAATAYSGLAQTALGDAAFVSKNILRGLQGALPLAYVPKQPVSVIPVGADWAAVERGKLHFSGKLGWLLRSAADLVGFSDIEPWWKAARQWLTEFGSQEECVTCSVAYQESPADILERS